MGAGVSVELQWVTREPPLAPAALVALGHDVAPLTERLARLDASVTEHLSAVTGELPLIALLGPHDWLPWSPGVLYLAPEPLVPTLYLPTTQRPTLPPALVLAALTRRFPELRPPLALLPTCCFSLAEAGALTSLPASLQTSLPSDSPSLRSDSRFAGTKGGGVRGGVTPPPRPSAPPLLPRNVEKEGEGVAE